jgi:hypothetical protein
MLLQRSRWLALVLFAGGLLTFPACTEPAREQSPEVIVKLTNLKTRCENMVQTLKQKGIDGKEQYEPAQTAVNECISYLSASIADNGGTEAKVKEYLTKVDTAGSDFLAWSDQQLHPPDPRVKKDMVAVVEAAAAVGAAV